MHSNYDNQRGQLSIQKLPEMDQFQFQFHPLEN